MSDRVELHADRGVCIGAGVCAYTDEQVFDQDDDGLVVLLDDRPEDRETIRRAVASCPSGALRLDEA